MSVAFSAGAPRQSGAATVAPPLPVTGGTSALAAPPTAAERTPIPGTPVPPQRFAELLRQSRAPAPPVPAAAPKAAPPTTNEAVESAADSSEAQHANANAARAAPVNAAKSRAATPRAAHGKAPDEAREGARDTLGRADDDVAIGADPASCGRADGAGPGLLLELAAVRRPAEVGDSEAPGDAAAADDGDASRGPDGRTGRSSGAGRARGVLDAGGGPRTQPAGAGRDAASDAAAMPAFQSALADAAGPGDASRGRATHEPALTPMAASLAGVGGLRGAELPAPVPVPGAVAIATPVDAPAFAAALGVHVSVLARDGVQEAELHLNPAEMGPVSIRISLDGSAARVDFGADLAATRQAIEQGLPELASALRDAGFTLAGGGVSQHAGSRAGSDGERAAAGSAQERGPARDRADHVPAPARLAQRTAGGGIDVYA